MKYNKQRDVTSIVFFFLFTSGASQYGCLTRNSIMFQQLKSALAVTISATKLALLFSGTAAFAKMVSAGVGSIGQPSESRN